ncbi:hypothetical protein PMAYCL1PPCAC_31492, partial [Pristionchus mayeri]
PDLKRDYAYTMGRLKIGIAACTKSFQHALLYKTSIPELVLSCANGDDPEYTLHTASTIAAMAKSNQKWRKIAIAMINDLVTIIDRVDSRVDEENTKKTEIAILC